MIPHHLRNHRLALIFAWALGCSLPQLVAQPAAVKVPTEPRSVSVVVREPVKVIASKRFQFQAAGRHLAIPCESTVSMTDKHPGIRHLVVMVHGLFRNHHYHQNILEALKMAGSPKDIAVISPQFLAPVDVEAHGLGTDHLGWSVNGWQAGDLSQTDPRTPKAAKVSSFEVMDSLIRWCLQAFPDLESAALCGFSAGGQFMSRYAIGNQVHSAMSGRGVDVAYVISSPSTYLYLCANRSHSGDASLFGPVQATSEADCTDYNHYPYGLENRNSYMKKAGDADKLRGLLKQRQLILLVGEKDDASASYGLADGCRSNLQGAHRLERALTYYDYLKFLHGPEAHEKHRLLIVPGAAHSARKVFASAPGVEALLGNYRR